MRGRRDRKTRLVIESGTRVLEHDFRASLVFYDFPGTFFIWFPSQVSGDIVTLERKQSQQGDKHLRHTQDTEIRTLRVVSKIRKGRERFCNRRRHACSCLTDSRLRTMEM